MNSFCLQLKPPDWLGPHIDFDYYYDDFAPNFDSDWDSNHYRCSNSCSSSFSVLKSKCPFVVIFDVANIQLIFILQVKIVIFLCSIRNSRIYLTIYNYIRHFRIILSEWRFEKRGLVTDWNWGKVKNEQRNARKTRKYLRNLRDLHEKTNTNFTNDTNKGRSPSAPHLGGE